MPDANRILVLQYAERDAERGAQFVGKVDNPDALMPMGYFVWLIECPEGPILVDTGFTRATGELSGRPYGMTPKELVEAAGYQASDITKVVITHLHYDHAGTVDDFPEATIVIQEAELGFWTGPFAHRMASKMGSAHLVQANDVVSIVRANLAGRVRLVTGDVELAPGVSAHLVGGHTPGMQVVSIATAIGDVVLASDVAHFYDNLTLERPFAVTSDLVGALSAFDRVRELASSDELVIPGHDLAVMSRFPAHPLAGDIPRAVVIG